MRSLDLLDEGDDALAEGFDELESVIERIAEERRVGGSVSWGHAMKEGTLASGPAWADRALRRRTAATAGAWTTHPSRA
ncbi:hypothetical protein [Streptomyces sp. NPDC001530]|uniref:hypothetical protein n=1 Tax=Streptomyces sp. NPDC001530 TaxID=3364582 RepID=UPI00369944AB